MRTYEVTRRDDDGSMRLRAKYSGRVLAVVNDHEARLLWINLGAALRLGTEPLTVRNVARASKPKGARQAA